ncbi:hypothetical protein EG68_00553 [Paragonimus skrjabini miyazakii]|uniref:UPF0506 domain-containing protein n=1 Tax=Paragonimus skrjabini miyazakii TaxID=59628 RepID=A0A8S9Z590_9TREM|nr:hypothetical protein EG68_00553 [Paragonimus skrjabini miyazakii]
MMTGCAIFWSLLLLLTVKEARADDCKEVGDTCDGTVFNRCCGELRCQRTFTSRGTCRTCIADGYLCGTNSHCCSKNCYFFQCKS